MIQLTKGKRSTHTRNLCTSPFLATQATAMKSQSQQQAQSSRYVHTPLLLSKCMPDTGIAAVLFSSMVMAD